MIATRQLLSLFALLPLIAFGAPATLQKDMSFTAARKLLLKEKWKPINIHAHDNYALMGVEHELAKMNIKEFDSCSIDYSNCVLRYKRGDACLSVFTIGEKVKYMKVVHWTEECPEPQPPAMPSSAK
ncbi:hypothetical protein RugamoR64_56640 [Duganella rhizosphaerae]|uniref:hypothetical protein n=1 Tax=Duganella rhizosphaerae TaxID=2885763 RepID=UPI0030E9A5A2